MIKLLTLKNKDVSVKPPTVDVHSASPLDVEVGVTTVEATADPSIVESMATPASVEPLTQAASTPLAPSYVMASDSWQTLAEAVVGLAHRARDLPCQDAAGAVTAPHPALVLADGAGSAAVSEIGARAVVSAILRLLDTLSRPLTDLLDGEISDPDESARQWGLLLIKHAHGIMKDLAQEHRRPLKDFRSTLLIMIRGQRRLLWAKVGDGSLVIERVALTSITAGGDSIQESELSCLGESGKGEFANETSFLDEITPETMQCGVIDATTICGMAMMSDGAAERLVANDGSRVASRVSTLLQQLRDQQLKRQKLTQMFYEEGFCHATTGDDRAIALAACELVTPIRHNQPG